MSEPQSEALALLEADPPLRVLAEEASLPPAESGEVRARIYGAEIAGEKELFAAIAAALSFPSWFGGNWDALLDCLRSVGGDQRPTAVTLAVGDAEALLSSAPRTAALLVETWAIAALWWAQRGVPFRLLLLIRE